MAVHDEWTAMPIPDCVSPPLGSDARLCIASRIVRTNSVGENG